jgi:hypothetical protein
MKAIEGKDYSCEIDMELNQLQALGDVLVESNNEPSGDDMLHGLGLLIRGIGERIEKMLDPTYKAIGEHVRKHANVQAEIKPGKGGAS